MSQLEKAVCQLKMKSCSLILLCLCITISAGHKAHHVSTSKGLPLLKRQAQDQCTNILVREICTNGYYEDYAFLAAQCFQRAIAQNIQAVCSVNAMGRICATIDTDPYNIESVCGTSSTTCSSGCASALTNLRAELGCCVNVYNTTDNITDSESSDQFVYSYALWSLCDVEPVTERCTPSFDLPTGTVITCNPLSFGQQLYSRVLCRAEFFDSLRRALTSGGCPDEASAGVLSSCLVDSDGQYCAFRGNLYNQMDSASMNCSNTDNCDESCIYTLNSIVDMSGCCFISEFNSSSEEPRDFLSYEFWRRCGLTSPGFCEVRLETSPTRISGSGAATISATAALFTLAVVSTFN